MALAPQQLPAPEPDLIPPAVRANAARADALMAEIAAQSGGTPPAPGTPAMPPPPPGFVVVPPAAPVAPVPVVNAPLIAPAPPAEQQLSVDEILSMTAEPGSELAKLQHAYKSLLGRHRSQVDKLTTELRTRTETPPARPFNIPEPTPQEQLIEAGATEDEVANFGDEMTAMVARIARGAAKAEAERMRNTLLPTIEQLGSMTAAGRTEQMIEYLDRQLEPWQVKFAQLNEHQPFLNWLVFTEPMSGATRQELLTHAWNSQNGSQVWAICSSFLNEVAPRSPAPVPPAPNGATPQVSLESLAAPGRGPRTVAPVNPQNDAKPHYTRQDVKDFYTAKANGFYSAEDALKWETEIALASREGRIH